MWPSGKHARGIDVSHHRGEVKWKKVINSGVSFAIVKATDGGTFFDPRFDDNWSAMRRAQVIRGAYHYFRPDVDPVVQAHHYLWAVGDILHESDLPPVLDFEAYPKNVYEDFKKLKLSKRIKMVKQWLTTVSDATGRLPVIYTNQHSWQYAMNDTEEFTYCPLWIANYGVSKPYLPANSWGGQGWLIWQFSSSGEVPGVNGGEPPVDLNIFHGKLQDIKDWLGIEGDRNLPPQITNKQMMDALLQAASELKQDVTSWLNEANLAYIVDPVSNAPRPYDGPAIEDMPFSQTVIDAIIRAIDTVIGSDPDPIYQLSNQQVINIFYQAASLLGIAGWTLLCHAELTDLVNSRHALYIGPTVMEMSGLTTEEKQALLSVIDPDTTPPVIPEPPEVPYPGLSNQSMINIFYSVAAQFDIQGWALITQAGLTNLADDRTAEYTGPEVGEMSGINEAQRALIYEEILKAIGQELEETYPGLSNQDIINLFYQAAARSGENGWTWIEDAGLVGLAATREMRMKPYHGPKIEDLAGLSESQKEVLQEVIQTSLQPL